MFDLLRYEEIFPFLRQKHFAAFHEIISSMSESERRDCKVLDLGSGNGSLIDYLRTAHVPMYSNSGRLIREITFLEPEIYGCQKIRSEAGFLEDKEIEYDVIQSDYEHWQQKHPEKYDHIIASHLFYHFNLADWASIITNLSERLEKGGKLYIVMVSKDSDIYHFGAESMRRNLGYREEVGRFLFAEDMARILVEHEFDFQHTGVTGRVGNCRDEFESENEYQKGWLNLLSFLHRQPKEMGKTLFGANLSKALKCADGDLFFEGHDGIFRLTKGN